MSGPPDAWHTPVAQGQPLIDVHYVPQWAQPLIRHRQKPSEKEALPSRVPSPTKAWHRCGPQGWVRMEQQTDRPVGNQALHFLCFPHCLPVSKTG